MMPVSVMLMWLQIFFAERVQFAIERQNVRRHEQGILITVPRLRPGHIEVTYTKRSRRNGSSYAAWMIRL